MTDQERRVLLQRYNESEFPNITRVIQTNSLEMIQLSDGNSATFMRKDLQNKVVFWSRIE